MKNEKLKKVISFVSQKGGCGKTSTLTNMAWCLSQKGFKVLVIDLDGQCNSSFTFGGQDYIKQNFSIVELLNLASRNLDFPEKEKFIMKCCYNDNIDLIVCSSSFVGLENVISNTAGGDFLLKKFFDETKLTDDYDFILIDNNPFIGKIFTSSICASDYLIIPVNISAFDIQGLMTVIDKIYYTIKNPYYKINVKVAGLVITRFDNTILSKETEIYCGKIGEYVFKNHIPKSVEVGKAQFIGSIVCKESIENKASKAYNDFTDEFLNLYCKEQL